MDNVSWRAQARIRIAISIALVGLLTLVELIVASPALAATPVLRNLGSGMYNSSWACGGAMTSANHYGYKAGCNAFSDWSSGVPKAERWNLPINYKSDSPSHGNCVAYVAYRLRQNGVPNFLVVGGNGFEWDDSARRWNQSHSASQDIAIVDSPIPGAVAQWEAGEDGMRDGHVAYVDWVDSKYVYLSESSWSNGESRRRRVPIGDKSLPADFLLPQYSNAVTPDHDDWPFADVSPSAQFATSIAWMKDNGITTVKASDDFGPDNPVSRGAAMVFLYRLAGSPSVDLPDESPFSDVSTTSSSYRAIVWASQQGITNGYADGTFGGSNNVNRGTFAVFLQRFSGEPLPASCPIVFADVPSDYQYLRQVCWMSQAGITSAGAGDKFSPNSTLTRGALSAFLYRMNYRRFGDLGMVDSGFDAVAWMQDAGILSVSMGGDFNGNDPITRAVVATYLYRAAGSPSVVLPAQSPFPDVTVSTSFYKAVVWSNQQGIFLGDSEGNFNPSGSITRALTALVLRRYAGGDSISDCSIEFADVDPGSSTAGSICWLAENGITSVPSGDEFDPNGDTTRMHFARFLYRMEQGALL